MRSLRLLGKVWVIETGNIFIFNIWCGPRLTYLSSILCSPVLLMLFHRITEWLKLEGTSGGHLVQPPCSCRDTWSRLLRTMFRQLLNISKDGDRTTSLGNLCQSSITLTVKRGFLMFRWSLLCFNLCPLPLGLSLGTTEKSLAPSSLYPLFRYLCTLIRSPRVFSSLG